MKQKSLKTEFYSFKIFVDFLQFIIIWIGHKIECLTSQFIIYLKLIMKSLL